MWTICVATRVTSLPDQAKRLDINGLGLRPARHRQRDDAGRRSRAVSAARRLASACRRNSSIRAMLVW
jgi:hypothetical protein